MRWEGERRWRRDGGGEADMSVEGGGDEEREERQHGVEEYMI